jgi:hypothetical protein
VTTNFEVIRRTVPISPVPGEKEDNQEQKQEEEKVCRDPACGRTSSCMHKRCDFPGAGE